MRSVRTTGLRLVVLGLLLLSPTACGQDDVQGRAAPDGVPISPSQVAQSAEDAIPSNPHNDAYFGELHMHSAYSLDAYIGGSALEPDEAYRFAKGESMTIGGIELRIEAPLDFMCLSDHAEYIGEMYSTLTPGAPGHDQDLLKQLRGLDSIEEREKWFLQYVVKSNRSKTPQHPPFYRGPDTTRSAWQKMLEAVDAHYAPGSFTTIPCFEWSSAPGGANLHRNVLFRDRNVPDLPMSYIEINREEALWDWMKGLEQQGVTLLAIPHNSNASKGLMFPDRNSSGGEIDEAYARTRNHFEPLIEIMQIKGNSEVHPRFWSNDEFAGFENAPSLENYSDRKFQVDNFVRRGLTKGVRFERELGVNPFQYGIVGGTDNHDGVPSNVAEDNFLAGSHGAADGTVERRRTGDVGGWLEGKDLNPGALTGVWASKNTRGAIWDALKRRETFATSGPRITLRFFGGFGLSQARGLADLVRAGYDEGVAMGGVLTSAERAGEAVPRFAVWASRDPNSGTLDRIQIVKGWADAEGGLHEQVFDVVWAGDREPGEDGRLPAIGSTVDTKTATFTDEIGSAELLGHWSDPDFDAAVGAYYYVRVLQVPTPRWSTYDAVRNDLPLLEDVPATVQERAWSSPIWYRP